MSGIPICLGDYTVMPMHDHTTQQQGGPIEVFSVLVDFGFQSGGEGDIAQTLVPASWVEASTILVATPAGVTTTDHDPDDVAAEGITAYVQDIVPGVGFTVTATGPNQTWGQYIIFVK